MTTHFSWQSAVLQSDCKSTTKLVLLVVGTYMNQHGTGAWPSYGTIAKCSSLGRSTVIDHIELAVASGWLKKAVRICRLGENDTNIYTISFPGVVQDLDHLVQMPDQGSPGAGPPSPDAGPGVVQELDPNTPVLTLQRTPHVTPKKDEAELPEWIPLDAWEDFLEMRRSVKAPLKGNAVKLVIRKLDRLMKAGQSPREVLEQSTMNSWKSVFEVKTAFRGISNRQSESDRRISEFLGSFGPADDGMTIDMEPIR